MKKVDRLRFGTAGIPLAAEGGDTEAGIAKVAELGLDSFELEFVRQVYVREEKAPAIRKIAESCDVMLTCHASYFINLNAIDAVKRVASRQRLLAACRIAALCGGYSTCVHAGAYLKSTAEQAYNQVKKQLIWVTQQLRDEGLSIWVRPETAGKFSQFGTMTELLRLSQEVEGVLPCIDFGHLRATTQANSYTAFAEVLEQVEKMLGKHGLHNLHAHVEGIAFGPRGEKNHLNLKESDFAFKPLMQVFKDFGVRGVVTCESPNIERDALLLKKTYTALQ